MQILNMITAENIDQLLECLVLVNSSKQLIQTEFSFENKQFNRYMFYQCQNQTMLNNFNILQLEVFDCKTIIRICVIDTLSNIHWKCISREANK